MICPLKPALLAAFPSSVDNYFLSTFLVIRYDSEVAQSCPAVCDSMVCSLPGSSVHGIFPDKSTRGGCHFLLQGIFPTQGSNPGIPQCGQTLYRLSHQGSPPLIPSSLWHLIHQELLLALPSKYIQNSATVCHSYCYHPG